MFQKSEEVAKGQCAQQGHCSQTLNTQKQEVNNLGYY